MNKDYNGSITLFQSGYRPQPLPFEPNASRTQIGNNNSNNINAPTNYGADRGVTAPSVTLFRYDPMSPFALPPDLNDTGNNHDNLNNGASTASGTSVCNPAPSNAEDAQVCTEIAPWENTLESHICDNDSVFNENSPGTLERDIDLLQNYDLDQITMFSVVVLVPPQIKI